MTASSEHPDAERLRGITEERNAHEGEPMFDAVARFVDPHVAKTLVLSYLEAVREDVEVEDSTLHGMLMDPNSSVMKTMIGIYLDGFLIGAQFQAAGGHREVDA